LSITEIAAFFLVITLFGLISSEARATPFDCSKNRCGIVIDAPYPNLVVGAIDGIASPSQAASMLVSAQKLGLWRLFPADGAAFASEIQPISVSIAPGRSITILAATSETRLSNLKIGQLVRFAPHRGLNEKPRPNDPYWVGVGCVILLCVPDDMACEAFYRPGVYKLSNGAELDATGENVLPGGISIDTFSMRPKTKAN